MARGRHDTDYLPSQAAPLRADSFVGKIKELQADLPEKEMLFEKGSRHQKNSQTQAKELETILSIGGLIRKRAAEYRAPFHDAYHELIQKEKDLAKVKNDLRDKHRQMRDALKELAEDAPEYESEKARVKAAMKERFAAADAHSKAIDTVEKFEAKLYKISCLKALGEIRNFGMERHELQVEDERMRRVIEGASSVYPSEWVKMARFGARLGMNPLYADWRDYEERNKHGNYVTAPVDEESSRKFGAMGISRKYLKYEGSSRYEIEDMRATAIHEYGHHMEFMFPHLYRAQEVFLAYRSEQKIAFQNEYVLHEYEQEHNHAEVLTCGMASLFSGSRKQFSKIKDDHNYQDFVLGLLAAV